MAGHAELDDKGWAAHGEESELLTQTGGVQDRLTSEECLWRRSAIDDIGAADGDRLDASTDDEGMQGVANGLDFGEFGHGARYVLQMGQWESGVTPEKQTQSTRQCMRI